ncbi:MAG: ABC transporter permease [Phycisphaerae bacterium]|nr:ABC transporter permease [Phycisphaerae bacterium]
MTEASAKIKNVDLEIAPEATKPQSRSWRRFRRNKPAMLSVWVLGIIIFLCMATLFISVNQYDHQQLELTSTAPTMDSSKLDRVLDPETKVWREKFAPFGYDSLGRNLLWRSLFGGMVSLGIGLAAAIISVSIGTGWGLIAGWYGGRIDNIMMRTVDILYGLPYILLVILFKIAFEPQLIKIVGEKHEKIANVIILFVAIGGISWLTMARVIRGQVMSLRSQPFIEAARAQGLPTSRIMLKHLLPNLLGPIIVYATLTVPQAILQESFLSYLGIGIKPPVPTWGSLASEAVKAVNTVDSFWWMITFPCVMLGLTLLCLNFIGDGLRDAFDPRTKKKG